MEQIDFTHSHVTYKKPVVTLTFKEGAHLDIKEVREMNKAAQKLAGNKPYLIFTDLRVFLSITPEARKIAADKKEVPLLVASAVLVNNLPLKLTANFFLKFNTPHFKYKIFTDEKKAMEWLLQFDPGKKN